MLNSNNNEEKLAGIKILGMVKNSYFGFRKLLEIISQEERLLEEKFQREKGYSLLDSDRTQNSIKELVFNDESISKKEKQRILSEDFKNFKEAEHNLSQLIRFKNDDFLKIIDDIKHFSLTARGFITEIIGRMRIQEKENLIIDFLESSLDESKEPSIEVRTAAFYCIDDWLEEEKDNKRLNEIIEKQRINPTSSEDYVGFPNCIDEFTTEKIESLHFLPIWTKNIKEKLDQSGVIVDSEIEVYLRLIKYIIKSLNSSLTFIDEDELLRSLKSDLNIEPKGVSLSLSLERTTWHLLLTIINGIALNGGEKAIQHLLEYTYDPDPIATFLTVLGLEMARFISVANETVNKNSEIIEERIKKASGAFFKEYGNKAILSLRNMVDFNFQNDSPFISFNEVIINVLKKVPDPQLIEDLIFEALSMKAEREILVYNWLFEISDKKTAERLKKNIINLKIEDSEVARYLLEKLSKS